MDTVLKNIRVKMILKDHSNIPCFHLPEGYALRWFRKGDDLVWRNIQADADIYNDITDSLFKDEFGSNSVVHAQRICFLENQKTEELVGTAAAWWQDNPDGTVWGRVHWVAIIPSYQGLGLSKGLLSAVCICLRELGHTKSFLTTTTARVPAINLYRLFGFQAASETVEEWKAWKLIEQDLKLGAGEDFSQKCPCK